MRSVAELSSGGEDLRKFDIALHAEWMRNEVSLIRTASQPMRPRSWGERACDCGGCKARFKRHKDSGERLEEDGSKPPCARGRALGRQGMQQSEQMTNLKVLDLSLVAGCTLRSRLERQAEIPEHAAQKYSIKLILGIFGRIHTEAPRSE